MAGLRHSIVNSYQFYGLIFSDDPAFPGRSAGTYPLPGPAFISPGICGSQAAERLDEYSLYHIFANTFLQNAPLTATRCARQEKVEQESRRRESGKTEREAEMDERMTRWGRASCSPLPEYRERGQERFGCANSNGVCQH